MQPEDIDKLFRAKLDQHVTPPPPSLWLDLQEQLEPEERKRRGGFWMYAVAAAVTLLLVAGGGWLFWRGELRPGANGQLATAPARPATPATNQPQQPQESGNTAQVNAVGAVPATPNRIADNHQTLAARPAPASSSSQEASAPKNTFRTPAKSAETALLAQTQRPAVRQPALGNAPASGQEPKQAEALLSVAQASSPALALQPGSTPAVATAAAAPAGTIEVEVRQQAETVALASAEEPKGRTRSRVLGALRQVRRLAQGEKPDLTEVGLPANSALTLQARVGNHTLTKTIEL